MVATTSGRLMAAVALEDPPVAGNGVRLHHGVEVAQAAHRSKPGIQAQITVIHCIHFDQRIEHALLAAALVEGDQGPPHLRVRPTVETLGLVAFLPVNERRAGVGPVYAVHDRVEAGAILRMSASSCNTKPSRKAPSSQYADCSMGQPVPSGFAPVHWMGIPFQPSWKTG